MILFYIGTPKTGSSSLKNALNLLGVEAVHDWQISREVLEYAKRGEKHPITIDYQGDAIAVLDFPIEADLSILEAVYPEAKFLAIDRDIEETIDSALAHVLHSRKTNHDKWVEFSTISFREHCEARTALFSEIGSLWIIPIGSLSWDSLIEALDALEVPHSPRPDTDYPRDHTTARKLDAIGLEYSRDFVSHHSPIWNKLFRKLKGTRGARFLEVGSFEGRSSKFWIEEILTGEGASLVCVDPWTEGFSRDAEIMFDRSILSTGRSKIVRKIRGRSELVLPRFDDNHFDGIYIDGSHEGRAVLLDGLNALRILKPGGVLLFDDYKWKGVGSNVSTLPGPAIDCFLEVCSDSIEVVHFAYQLAVKKN